MICVAQQLHISLADLQVLQMCLFFMYVYSLDLAPKTISGWSVLWLLNLKTSPALDVGDTSKHVPNIMVNFITTSLVVYWEFVPFYGRKIQVSEILSFTQKHLKKSLKCQQTPKYPTRQAEYVTFHWIVYRPGAGKDRLGPFLVPCSSHIPPGPLMSTDTFYYNPTISTVIIPDLYLDLPQIMGHQVPCLSSNSHVFKPRQEPTLMYELLMRLGDVVRCVLHVSSGC